MNTLNGPWTIAPDPDNVGRAEGWWRAPRPDAVDAPVPGIIQQALPGQHGVFWYWHRFQADPIGAGGSRALLRFGAVDYLGEVWLNGHALGQYESGELPFEFDVTEAIRADSDNLLAVRVLNPTGTPIDGYVLAETPHRNKALSIIPGSPTNTGGILYPVTLRVVPAVHVRDVFARPDPRTGRITVTVTVFNSRPTAAHGDITLTVGQATDGETLASVTHAEDFPPGESTHEIALSVGEPRLWNLDDPHLYGLTTVIQETGAAAHTHAIRIGFRELRVVDGYFELNGKRIFLKSTHTGNHQPIGANVPVIPDFVRRDLIFAKASGFNMVRFISGTAYPEQLDFCDALGLMVYEESLAAWLLADSPKMGERYDRNTGDMIRRDRNHACVTIWGLLNETNDSPTFRHAVDYLPKARALDPTRLILLASGRFDEALAIGSLSNPGGTAWEHVWGVERPGAPRAQPRPPSGNWSGFPPPGYVGGAGDAHVYPQMPLTPAAIDFMKRLGADSKPVLLSEYGIGSQQNVISEWRNWEQTGAPPLEEGAFLRDQAEKFQADWRRLGFDDVYAFPEDMLRESQRLHSRQRAYAFDLIRANPRLAGYNLTGMLDHALTGEGLWTFFRQWKPGAFDAVWEGWAALRWCLLADPTHASAGQTVTLEASLANEGALKPGEYPARFRLLGPGGVAWEKTVTIAIPDPSPLAVPVLRDTVVLAGPPGAYTFAANLERGGAPAGGRMTVHLSDLADLLRLTGDIALWGIDAREEAWLTARGLRCRPFNKGASGPADLILVGLPPEAERTPAAMAALTRRLSAGATVIALNHAVFANGADSTAYLPLARRGKAYTATDWLYHKECVSRRHPVFEGLQGPGIMDWDYYGPVVPHEIYEGLDAPDDMIAASFAVGHHRYPGGYAWGLLMGEYRLGAGRLILSTLPLLENLDAHPAADRLLVNLIRHAQTRRQATPPRPEV
ncbi:MAG: hypothetical protein IPO29_13695 [Anaerolineae bacterium]|nr:hypothetical protein [Anaerolineae bacterium]